LGYAERVPPEHVGDAYVSGQGAEKGCLQSGSSRSKSGQTEARRAAGPEQKAFNSSNENEGVTIA
jgi:hypothetical protein